MIEIPESVTLADQLNETVFGQRVVRVIAGASPHKFAFLNHDPADYDRMLSGRVLGTARSYGGQVEIEAGEMRLLLAEGPNVRYTPPGTAPPSKHQLFVELDNGAALTCSVQMYGVLHLFKEGENDNFYYLISKEKPSPLNDAFNREHFSSLLSSVGPKMSVKAFLATEQRIPGLGNGVLQDILFHAGIHPKKQIGQLISGDLDKLFDAVKRLLADMSAKGGRDTEKNLFGIEGGYATILSSKRWKEPCPVCGGAIVRQAYLGGNIYFCPVCQLL